MTQYRTTIADLKKKKNVSRIVSLTAYTAPMAHIIDEFADFVLVGDSMAMVLYGEDTTLGLDVDTVIRHGRAVVKHTENSLVVVDMPFGSYQESKELAFRHAARILGETGCGAVKLEGGPEMAETIRYLTERCIPVMAHIGMQPQSVFSYGGFKVQGQDQESRAHIIESAKAVEDAGAFAVVLECIPESLAREITKTLKIPTIGIGASSSCDGQILVTEDMLGLALGRPPKFVKAYDDLKMRVRDACKEYAEEVQQGVFPDVKQSYKG